MITSEIKQIMKKEIKEIKKLYQATIHGFEPENFHKKCDEIKNILVLYKSAGNRRFGALTSEYWKSENSTKLDKNCFLFSLDKNKIYPPKKIFIINLPIIHMMVLFFVLKIFIVSIYVKIIL